MNGSNMTLNEQRLAAIAATATPPAEGDFVWDGKDEDDRPLTKDEMRAAIKNKGGRPKLATPKEHLTIRLDADIVAALRASGKGWQTRVNDALRQYVAGQH